MPVFNLQFGGQGKAPDGSVVQVPAPAALQQRGPVVPVSICLEQNMARPILAQGKPILGQQGFALIDSGASLSAVDEETAQALKIPIVDQAKVSSASHESHPCNIYPIQISVGGNLLVLQIPRALGLKLKNQGIIAIIGRDILQNCILVYNGTMGTVSISI